MKIQDGQVPQDNVQIFQVLYQIEVGLRELIIDSLSSHCGPIWWKSRLPGDVLDSYRKGLAYERGIKWIKMLPHHPIYYIDFPDLRHVITRNDNWSEVFQSIFGRKDIIENTLSEIEPIRNKIAHNRKATAGDVRIVEKAYEVTSQSVGTSLFHILSSKLGVALDIRDRLLNLQNELQNAFEECRKSQVLEPLDAWNLTCSSWWFDSEYLGHEINEISACFDVFEEYARLPRNRGQGHRIEAWIVSHNIEKLYCSANAQMMDLLKNNGGISCGSI